MCIRGTGMSRLTADILFHCDVASGRSDVIWVRTMLENDDQGPTSQILSRTDFKRFRDEARSRRRELVDSVTSAKLELLEIDRFLKRLDATERQLFGSDAGTFELDNFHAGRTKTNFGLPEMVSAVLRTHAERRVSPAGLKPMEISAEISRRFDMDISPRSVNSHVHYLYSRGRLTKAGPRYSLLAIDEQDLDSKP